MPLEGDAFATGVPVFDFNRSLTLQSMESGVFCLQPEQNRMIVLFKVPGGDDSPALWIDPWSSVVIAPSGRYASAQAENRMLGFYRTEDLSVDVTTPQTFAGASACDATLAWATKRERVACVIDLDGRGEVRIVDVPDEGSNVALVPVTGEYDYGPDEAFGRRRVFSPHGRWLAFAGANSLYLAEIEPSPQLRLVLPETPPDIRMELCFSPDERWLAKQSGTQLSLYDLDSPDVYPLRMNPDSPVVLPDSCEEDFVSDPDNWCGNARRANHFAWSPDSTSIAYETSVGTLWLVDVSHPGMTDEDDLVHCDQDCTRQFQFQP